MATKVMKAIRTRQSAPDRPSPSILPPSLMRAD
jgi:hypothetical protein